MAPSSYYAAQPPAPPIQPISYPPQPSTSYFPPQPAVVVDDEAIAMAQKQARWAISALNYEDIDTAVKELRNALNTLGAS
jgi:vacuolar protein sorting-associated protein VTA1